MLSLIHILDSEQGGAGDDEHEAQVDGQIRHHGGQADALVRHVGARHDQRNGPRVRAVGVRHRFRHLPERRLVGIGGALHVENLLQDDRALRPVSYTQLDVYKRQPERSSRHGAQASGPVSKHKLTLD